MSRSFVEDNTVWWNVFTHGLFPRILDSSSWTDYIKSEKSRSRIAAWPIENHTTTHVGDIFPLMYSRILIYREAMLRFTPIRWEVEVALSTFSASHYLLVLTESYS